MNKDTIPSAAATLRSGLLAAALLVSPALALASTAEAAGSSQESSGALNELAKQEDQISDFVKAVEQAGMADALTEGGTKYTIFAPTNEAFQSSDRNLDELLSSGSQEELVNILRAHIVADDVDPEMAKRIGKAQTLGGGTVSLTSEGETLKVGDAKVVASDIQQGNLRVYAIDGVLEAGEPGIADAGSRSTTGQSGSQPGAEFAELDANGDGYLSEDEMQSHQDLASQKDQLDRDGDGQLNRSEFAAFERMSGTESAEDNPSASDMPPHNESGDPDVGP